MGFLSKLKHLELLLTPTAPKKGSVPLPEVDEVIVYPVSLSVAGDEDGSAGSDYTSSPPATPFFRRRLGSFLSRPSTPKHDSRPATPIKASSPPVLVAPTPRWKTPPSLREQGWKNVSPGPEPELKARPRSNSMQYPPRSSTTRQSERSLSPEVLKAKQRSMTPQVPPRSPESVARRAGRQTPDVLKHHFPTTTQSPLRPSSSRPSTTTLCDDRADSPYSKARVTRSASRPSAPTSPSPKGILKPSSPTPDDSALVPFREPSTPPPSSPSPPIPLPSHSFGLHWQLLPPNPVMGKHLRFDMALPVTEIRKYTNGVPLALGSRDLSKSAVEGLQLTRMTMQLKPPENQTVEMQRVEVGFL